MKLKQKLILNTFSIVAIGLGVFLSFWIINDTALNDKQQFKHLTSIREEKSRQIENYFKQLENEIIVFSKTPCIVQATEDFSRSFEALNDVELIELNKNIDTLKLRNYYLNYFLPKLNKRVIKQYVLKDIEPNQKNTKLLQHFYIADNKFEHNEKYLLTELTGVDIEYASIHKKIHPYFREVIKNYGYYDLFLVDLKGNIVYSVFKETDFGTNLLNGSYSSSGLAEAFKKASKTKQTVLIDFKNYTPSFEEPASFMGTPIKKNNTYIGYIFIQIPINEIEFITTGEFRWEKEGLGKTGETLIIGSDYLARSNSRFFIQDSTTYLTNIQHILTEVEIQKIKTFNNTILSHPIQTLAVKNSLEGLEGTEILKDYRGVDVLSSYAPLEIKGVDWIIVSQIDKSEVRYELMKSVEFAICVFFILLLILYFSTIQTANHLAKPIIGLSESLRNYGESKKTVNEKLTLDFTLSNFENRNDEVGELGRSFHFMKDKLDKSFHELQKLLSEKKNTNEKLKEAIQLLEENRIELQKSMNLISLIIKNSTDAIITINEQLIISQFNPAAENIFGYKKEEIVGKSLNILLPLSHRESHKDKIDGFGKSKINSKKMADRIVEVMGLRKNGSVFPAEIGISKLRIDNELMFTAFLRDISERRALEKKLLQTEKMASLGVLTAGVAHEINNPLNYIHGAYTAINKQIDENTLQQNDLKKYLEWVKTGVQRIANIVRSLNKFTLTSSISEQECDLNKIISISILEIKEEIDNTVEIRKQLTDTDVKIKCNSENIKEVILSLIRNAIDAVEKNGLIVVTTKVMENRLILTVEDNGYGISKENLNKIFDPFFTTKPPTKGAGLGLSIVHAIIEEHKGKISIESELNKGTKVTVILDIV